MPDLLTTRAQLADVLAQLADLLDAIGPAGSTEPTPCEDYSVNELRTHVVSWLTAFSDGIVDADGTVSDPEGVRVSGSGGDQVRRAADLIDAALAGGADHALVLGGNDLPMDVALPMILGEYQVHGWDLAVATGNAWQPDEAGLEASLQFFPAMLTEDAQGEGKTFKPRVPVPDDASALDRLLGLTGRNPAWAP
ncbi:TIGR03086 family metal-binding protein [Nigerium massiliense]|uniref:TIGR03086 family metal-binding protein n=1 Tax=Nigerium massiliense TaxID=1522317 RepID=UPI000694B634|nr:TIGR03086 family metal-binding protein [Nigerium massiliense]